MKERNIIISYRDEEWYVVKIAKCRCLTAAVRTVGRTRNAVAAAPVRNIAATAAADACPITRYLCHIISPLYTVV